MVAQSLASLLNELQALLQQGGLSNLGPFLELVGSMAEGTRIGLANEFDVALKFQALMDKIPFRVDKSDPFFLKRASSSPSTMEDFFKGDVFQFHNFLHFLLDNVETAVSKIFKENRNPSDLSCVTTNRNWNEGKTPCSGRCKKNLRRRNFVQCEICRVTVSQTKSGMVLQFLHNWHGNGEKVYCSIDLIPIFPIEAIPSLELTRSVVESMLGVDPPPGWLHFMFKYPEDYRFILELAKSGSGKVFSVCMKTMSFLEGRNHHIKPSQEFTETKFSSERMRQIYSYIKFLKKVLNIDLCSYWVKKELMRETYQSILDSCTEGQIFTYPHWCTLEADKDDIALVKILSQPEFKSKFEHKIDFYWSARFGFIQFADLEGRLK